MEQRRKPLPVGVDSFEKLREWGSYYVDKTGLILELLQRPVEVTLFTRPRRFGKSLNMSMLKAFFSPDSDKRIFEGLKILENREICAAWMGQYPVISLSLKSISAENFETASQLTASLIREAAMRVYRQVGNSERLLPEERETLRQLLVQDIPVSALYESLYTLCTVLHQHYGRKVVLLIDEYDVPLAKAHAQGYYDQMVILIRNLFEKALKSNDSLQFAVLTGCMRIAKESIFTGMNNLRVLGVADTRCDTYFGFTDQEVRDMLACYGLTEQYETVKEWYDGYKFGDTHLYCPWDVINYCDQAWDNPGCFPENYWINSSGNDIVRKFIAQSGSGSLKREIEALVNGEAVEKTIHQELTYRDMYASVDNIWSVLFTTGYLTQEARLDRERFRLVIPNREIRSIFQEQILEFFRETVRQDRDMLDSFFDALESGDCGRLTAGLNAYLRRTVSIRDTAVRKEQKENFYHGILLGIFSVQDGWSAGSNREAGDGYSDLLVCSDDYRVGAVVEIKYAEDGSLERACRAALEQIETRHYADILYEEGYDRVLKYAAAFYKKSCLVMLAESA